MSVQFGQLQKGFEIKAHDGYHRIKEVKFADFIHSPDMMIAICSNGRKFYGLRTQKIMIR